MLRPGKVRESLGCAALGVAAGERKQRFRRKAEELGLISSRNVSVWKSKNGEAVKPTNLTLHSGGCFGFTATPNMAAIREGSNQSSKPETLLSDDCIRPPVQS